ncbi:weak neurotoxin 5-like, partial [Thamnophis elegans]|uniref:weak neurotoxin 5-like n=1 Tax=Thamnophis elegans TaxID=35005 RepID=UPI001376E467
MKTLLLALLVVTVVCLDFGDTLICYKCKEGLCITERKCSNKQNLCFKRRKLFSPFGLRTRRGCAATCPTRKRNNAIECCSENRCNPNPKPK